MSTVQNLTSADNDDSPPAGYRLTCKEYPKTPWAEFTRVGWTLEQLLECGHAEKIPEGQTPLPDRGIVPTRLMASFFEGWVYVQDIHMMVSPEGYMLKKEQFDADKRFSGRRYGLDYAFHKGTDSAWDAYFNCQYVEYPQVRGTVFDPSKPEGAIVAVNGADFVNIWRNVPVVSKPGDASPFVAHVLKILPNGDDAKILLCYLATMVQHRGAKAMWAIFLQGMEGNGKSLIGEKIMRYCLGRRYVYKARSKNLDSKFNSSYYGTLLVLVDDVKVKGDTWEMLKPMITDATMEIEGKGANQVTREVCFNFIFTANPKDGLKKSSSDRRICPLFCAQQDAGDLERDGLTEDYFVKFHHWLDDEGGLAVVADYLAHYEIDPAYNFATQCIRAPRTSSTAAALQAGKAAVRQRMEEKIEGDDINGLRGGWINWTVFKQQMDQDVEGRHMAPGERRELLAVMGYIRHPGLNFGKANAGQVDNPLPHGGGKPYLYIKADHADRQLKGVRVAQCYVAAQTGTIPPPPNSAP